MQFLVEPGSSSTWGYLKKIVNEQIITTCGAALLITMSALTKIFYQQLLSCYLESIAAQSGKCVRHLIRLKHNPLRGKQLICLIILHYLLTPHSHKILDFNTQPAWDHCAEGFVCLVMAEKYLMFEPPLAQCSYVQHDLFFFLNNG